MAGHEGSTYIRLDGRDRLHPPIQLFVYNLALVEKVKIGGEVIQLLASLRVPISDSDLFHQSYVSPLSNYNQAR